MELNNYLLDVVYHRENGVQMITYKIAASSAQAAYHRWADEDTTDFPIVYEGDIVSAIIVGIEEQR